MTVRSSATCTAAALVAAAVCAAAAHAGGLRPVWQVARAVHVAHARTVRLGAFRLPAGTRQGPATWYTIRLRARLVLLRRNAECGLGAATDGATAAQIVVKTHPTYATVSALGWIQGSQVTTTRSRIVNIDFRNYLQIHGVKAGVNPFTVTVDRLAGPCFASVTIERGTGIATTTANPVELRVRAAQSSFTATRGHVLSIPYEVTRRGGWPDRGAAVQLSLPAGWKAAGPTTQRFARIGRLQRGTFRVVPGAVGAAYLSISVPRLYNQPHTAFPVAVVASRRTFLGVSLPLLLSASLIVTAVGLTRASWRRRKAEKQARS